MNHNSSSKDIRIPLERTGGRAILEPGIYKARIENIEQKIGKASGQPYLNLTLSIMDVDNRPLGNKVWDTLSFLPTARFKIDEFLDALDAPTTGSVSTSFLRNKVVFVTLGTEAYQGTLKNIVKQYITPETAQKQLLALGREISIDDAFNDSYAAIQPNEDDDLMPASGPQVNMPDEMGEDDVLLA
jgi:hypothetical protein